MLRTPPIPPELWEQIPPHVRAVLGVVFEGYERRIATLEREVAELKEQARKTSQNSSKPPSTDGPHVKRKPPKEPSGRKPGGQPGHLLHRRALVPLERVNAVVTCRPTHCRRCGQRVEGQDAQPLRHQVVELPPVTPHVTEYQVHRLYCPGCGVTTCGIRSRLELE
jgi:transposase